MKIKILRIQKGWTQAKLASLTGLSLHYIRSLETGRRTPSIPTAKKIAEILGCETIDEIIGTNAS